MEEEQFANLNRVVRESLTEKQKKKKKKMKKVTE